MILTIICLGIYHNQINTNHEKLLNKKQYILPGIFIFIFFSFTVLNLTFSSISHKKMNNYQQAQWLKIENTFPNQPVLIVDGSKGFATNNINPFNNIYNSDSPVKIYYSSWLGQSPVNKRIIKNLNSETFFTAIIERKILMYSEADDLRIFNPIVKFIKEHYNRNVQIEPANSTQSNIYKVYETGLKSITGI